MASNFGESVHYELKQNVDVTVWEPGMVYSNIHVKEPPSMLTKTTKSSVADILCLLGKERRTRGSLFFSLMPMPPNSWTAPIIEKQTRNEFEEMEKKTT